MMLVFPAVDTEDSMLSAGNKQDYMGSVQLTATLPC